MSPSHFSSNPIQDDLLNLSRKISNTSLTPIQNQGETQIILSSHHFFSPISHLAGVEHFFVPRISIVLYFMYMTLTILHRMNGQDCWNRTETSLSGIQVSSHSSVILIFLVLSCILSARVWCRCDWAHCGEGSFSSIMARRLWRHVHLF